MEPDARIFTDHQTATILSHNEGLQCIIFLHQNEICFVLRLITWRYNMTL